MQVAIECPVCQSTGTTMVPDYLLEKSKGGVIAIQVRMKKECQHSFITFIDLEGLVRGYQVLDYLVDMGAEEAEVPEGLRPTTIKEIHKIMGLAAIGHMLAALSTDKEVLLVGDKKTGTAIVEYFDGILPDAVNRDLLQSISSAEYKQMKKQDEKSVTIDLTSRAVLGTPFKPKETEWFSAPVSKAINYINQTSANSFLTKEYMNIWNRLSFLRHLLDRAKKRDQSQKDDFESDQIFVEGE